MIEPNWALARKHDTLIKRARIIAQVRAFFSRRGFLEVETPYRIPANAPELHIDPQTCGDWFLHTSPEIAMKRMLAAGYEKIFQICRVWRNGEHGQRHLPEFTMLEWYTTGADYSDLMAECEDLLQTLVPSGRINYRGIDIKINGPWERLTVAEAFSKYASQSLGEALRTDRYEEILTEQVEPKLGLERPTFLTDYPVSMAALARTKADNPDVAERFELYICGIELANAFSELTNPREQRSRFEHDAELRIQYGKEQAPFPERFLKEMENLPEAAGIALGIDRLVMLLSGAKSINDVVAFTPEEL